MSGEITKKRITQLINYDVGHNPDGSHKGSLDIDLSANTDFTQEHNADGTHGDITCTSIVNTGTHDAQGGVKLNAAASADPNTLDDYEEGDWTPTANQGVTTPTYSAQEGKYTIIGRELHFEGQLELSGGTLNGSQVRIGGLPVTPDTDIVGKGSGATPTFTIDVGLVNSCLPTLKVNTSGGTGYIFFQVAGTGASYVGTDITNNTWRIEFFGKYIV